MARVASKLYFRPFPSPWPHPKLPRTALFSKGELRELALKYPALFDVRVYVEFAEFRWSDGPPHVRRRIIINHLARQNREAVARHERVETLRTLARGQARTMAAAVLGRATARGARLSPMMARATGAKIAPPRGAHPR